MKPQQIKLLSSTFVVLCIVAALMIINWVFPFTFSIYFIICGISMVLQTLLRKKDNKLSLLLPWALTMTASVLVTHNYLHPDTDVYNNSDYHVLSLRGVDVANDLKLISQHDRANSLFDDPSYRGEVLLHGDGDHCELTYAMTDQPLYVGDGTRYRLANREQLPSIRQSLTVATDSSQLEVRIHHFEHREKVDSIHVYLTYRTTMRGDGDTLATSTPYERCDTSSFKRYITESYNLYDMARGGVSFDPAVWQDAEEEHLLSAIRDVSVVRDDIVKGGSSARKADTPYYVLLPSELPQDISILCDGQPVVNHGQPVNRVSPATVQVQKAELFYIGCGEESTRPMACEYDRQTDRLRLNYHLPVMYHFPVEGRQGSSKRLSRHHIVNITTSSEDLVHTEVKQSFFYDLFHLPDNRFHIHGMVSYNIGDSHNIFSPKLIDANIKGQQQLKQERTKNPGKYTLVSKNGSVWHFSVDNLRKTSPVTGKSNLFVRDLWIMGVILFMFLFALVAPLSLWPRSKKSNFALGVWLFFGPMIVMRLYLLWRIAVFPPLEQISRRVLMQYRMETGGMRNAMVITLMAIGVLMLLTIAAKWLDRKSATPAGTPPQGKQPSASLLERLSATQLKILFGVLWVVTYGLHFVSNSPYANLFAPLVVFFFNEYLCLKRLPMIWRGLNIALALGAFLAGDPGYAIMFFIFACLYTAYMMLVYRRSVKQGERRLARHIALLCFILCAVSVCLSSWLMGMAYNETPLLGLRWLTVSRVLMTTMGAVALWLLYRASAHFGWLRGNRTLRWGLMGLSTVVVLFVSAVVVPAFINKNGHFKYRSMIHTQEVGAMMSNENILERNSDRLLQASQNQWFLQYHDNKGDADIFNGDIFTLSPHFRKGVTWPTQVSDVILSRYVIGEISTLLPIFIIALSLLFLLFLFRSPNLSATGRILSWAFALLIAVQMTFVWMANTNRMIFFGQDFPFLSHNALVTSTLFALLLGASIILFHEKKDTGLRVDYLTGVERFVQSPNVKIFFGLYILFFGIVYFTGNRYSSLYGGKEAGRYNLNTTMQRAQNELERINASIMSYHAKRHHQLKNDEDLTQLWNAIEHETSVKEDVDRLFADTSISQFTYSLYEAFRTNLKNRNRFDNVIHLRHVGDHYELALNNGFYSLRSPEEDRKGWSGSIFTDVIDTRDDRKEYHLGQEDENFRQIIIPAGWVKNQERVSLIDCRAAQARRYQMILHHGGESYAMKNCLVFPLHKEDIAEFTSKNPTAHPEFTVSLQADENRLLVKNIDVNGHARPVYLKRDHLYWLREFTNMLSNAKDSLRETDQLITIDGELQDSVMLLMRREGPAIAKSVVAMDGHGNVRLMADYKGRHYILDPNDDERISSLIEQTYLNPVPHEDRKWFGNMNLYYMLPGPGSSLKPLTYAAVTSQSIGYDGFDWESLRLKASGSVIHKYGVEELDYDIGKPKAKQGWHSPPNDEMGDGIWIDNHFYLKRSSNFYNALVTYIGMTDMTADKARTMINPAADYYPVISLGGLLSSGSLRHPMAERLEGRLPLFSGLNRNLGLTVATGRILDQQSAESHACFISSQLFNADARPEDTYVWVYPNASSAYYSAFNQLAKPHRLRQYTLGASPLQLTPLKMAEMYGRLFSQSRDYYAHITPMYETPRSHWATSNGVSPEQLFHFYQRTLFTGMKQCYESGTGLSMILPSQLPSEYHYYMKTGTLNIDENHPSDRLLAVIITDRDVCTASSPSDYHFYVVYFRYVQSKGIDLKTQTTATLQQIIQSNSFQEYFNSPLPNH